MPWISLYFQIKNSSSHFGLLASKNYMVRNVWGAIISEPFSNIKSVKYQINQVQASRKTVSAVSNLVMCYKILEIFKVFTIILQVLILRE